MVNRTASALYDALMGNNIEDDIRLVQVNVRVRNADKRAIDEICRRKDITQAEYVRRALTASIRQDTNPPTPGKPARRV